MSGLSSTVVAKVFFRLLLLAATLGVVGCVTPRAGDVRIREWTLLGGGPQNRTVIKCQLGTLYVPENRSNPNSRVIGIGFLRIKGPEGSSAPPTIHLPGGPGVSFLERLHANLPSESDRTVTGYYFDSNTGRGEIQFYTGVSDMIFLDQRGFSDRHGDVLTYDYWTTAYPLDVPGSVARETADFIRLSRRIVEHYGRNTRIDLAGYTVKECAADVNDLCKALRYERVTLVGNSFGGQWGLATIRLFPDIVARAIISGVEPLDGTYDMPSYKRAALKRTWERWAAQNSGTAAGVPAGGIDGVARIIIDRLNTAGIPPVGLVDSAGAPLLDSTGAPVTITLGREDFDLLEYFYDQPGLSGPDKILEVYNGNYKNWANEVWKARQSRQMTLQLIDPLIETSSAATAGRRQRYRAEMASGEIVLLPKVERNMATEQIWPTDDVGDDFRKPRPTDVKVLFVQGTLDWKTPSENLEEIQDSFTNSHTLKVVNGEHEVLKRARDASTAVARDIKKFLETGDLASIPSSVTLP